MDKVEKIEAEIERRIAEITDICQGYIADKQMKAEYLLLHELLSFIDSLSDTEKDFGIKESVIPFGASDSELIEATYFIPQGYHAVIDGNKVIIKKGEEPVSNTILLYGLSGSVGIEEAVKETEEYKEWQGDPERQQSFIDFAKFGANYKHHTSNDLEEACDEYYDETWDEHGGKAMVVDGCHDIWFPSQATDDFFKAGAQWRKEQMAEEACKWLELHDSYAVPTNIKVRDLKEHLSSK